MEHAKAPEGFSLYEPWQRLVRSFLLSKLYKYEAIQSDLHLKRCEIGADGHE